MRIKNLVLVGLQWGDEGKGKVVDILEADFVIRFQGGNNAGHTIVLEEKKFILHQIPSGILKPHCEVFLGSGMVIDLVELVKEITNLEKQGIVCQNRIFISELAHLILPIHKIKDILQEEKRGKNSIGTTQKGIGPAYTDKISRKGIRIGEIDKAKVFQKKFLGKMKKDYQEIETECKKYKLELVDPKKIYDELIKNYQKIKNSIQDPLAIIVQKKQQHKKILLEGAQGSLLDIDYGSYPFVTSSNTIAAAAILGSGLSFRDIHGVLGLFKAYTTRVGQGPFPTEQNNHIGTILQQKGGEFGSTTGRERRCGWLDLCLLRKTIAINAVDYLALMKLDVLDSLDEIKVCTYYKLQGKIITMPPNNTTLWNILTPQYQTFLGWKKDTSKIKKYNNLPKNCQNYINFLQKELKTPIVFISISPKREDYIMRENFF